MSTKKKTIIISNFRGISEVPANYIESKWAFVEKEVNEILKSPKYDKSLEELYRLAEELYTQNFLDLLMNLQIVIENYLHEKSCEIIKENKEFMKNVTLFWKEFCSHVRTMKNIFLYFDRSSKFFKFNNVQTLSYVLFIAIIIQQPRIKTRLIEEVIVSIHMERQGSQIDRHLVQSVIDMLNTLNIYDEIIEQDILKSSHRFYREEGARMIQICNIPQYLSHVNQRIFEEQDRITSYLNKNIENCLMDILYKQLIENHITEILNKGFDELIDKSMFNELMLIYKLFQKIVNGSKHLISHFKDFIIKTGIAITDIKNEKSMIQDLLDFKDNLEKIITTSFDDQKDFHECVRTAFKNFINSCNIRAAQLLAKYLDNKLRSKDINDEDLEVVLNKVIKLFKYVQGKDIFEAFYKKHLAKRLLLGKSANQDAENSMITKLKEECGSAFTSNIEGMFQDINLSRTINTSFKQRMKNNEINSFNADFSVNVLTSSYWPNYPVHKINLPTQLVNYQLSFEKFYLSNHSGRKLFWQPSLSHCLLRGNFECGSKELQVSLFQTVVLLLFNSSDEFAYKEIQESTNLDKAELKRTLLSLACGKTRVLIKNPKGKDIEDEDVFIFNCKFNDKLFRVRINQIQLQDSAEEEKETEKNVLADRQFQIDAAIVRIMKQKKTIKHNMLVRELYNVLDIPVNQSDLKKRIELLIEREYMERDKENKSNYIYIA